MTTETTAAVETTPAAPAATAAPAQSAGTADPKQPAVSTPEVFTFEDTGNANANYALDIIGKAGIGPDHPAAVAAYDGDFSQLKHVLAAKSVPGADALVTMLEAAAADANKSATEKFAKIEADVYQMAGGKEQWETVEAWARDNADQGEKDALNELFQNPATHKIAAGYLLAMFDRSNTPRTPAAEVTGGRPPAAAATSAAPGAPLSRAEFAKEAQALYAKYGNNYTQSAEYAALGKRLR